VLNLLADVLNGGALRIDAREHEAFVEAADRHGVLCLIAEACGSGNADGVAAELRDALMAVLRRECVLEAVRLIETRRVLQALADAGVPALVIKGTALAYTRYANPWLRPRFDTDLLVAREDALRARRVLERLGYIEPPFISGELLMHQADYRRDYRGIQHRCDLHWRTTNPAMFAELFPFDEVARRAQPIAALGPTALTLDTADALLLACVHRVAHHRGDRLIWLYDVHLLARALDADSTDRFANVVRHHAVHAICADTVRAARRLFGTALTPKIESLEDTETGPEPSAVFLRAERRPVNTLLWDLRALGSWKDRVRLLREHLLPPVTYIRRVYGVSSRWVLPFCYAHRAVTGAARWMKRTE
jgi:hypothetical protein